jgi:hypothetical protein
MKTKDAMLASSSGNRVKTRTAVNTWTYYKADVFIYSARYLPIGLASTRFSLAEFTLHFYFVLSIPWCKKEAIKSIKS